MVITDKHILFWGDWPSNFAWAPIEAECEDGVIRRFFSSEQYFMWHKAHFFKDYETQVKIEELDFYQAESYEAKKLGRQVKGFDQARWENVAFDTMFKACLAKYSQNKVLFDLITDPALEGKKFVEASPYDKIWGIGLGEGDPLADDESMWPGKNWLGLVLDKVRKTLLNGYKAEIKY